MAFDQLAGKAVLVVEDDEVQREGLATILQRAGFRVAITAGGEGALAFLRDNPPPAVILLDMLLPDLDGWGFLEMRRYASPPGRGHSCFSMGYSTPFGPVSVPVTQPSLPIVAVMAWSVAVGSGEPLTG